MKAIALFSGGLDSTLAMKLIIDQGIDVIALNVNTGFGSTKDRLEHMRHMCDQVGATLKIVDIKESYLDEVLFNPKHGYGKNFNPCIDCHAKMFRVAKEVMQEEGASFLISGEVLGQRPMSQNKDALNTVLEEGDCDGLLLRPMSAKQLKPTIPENEGWVDREKLEGISGRSRTRQMELAREFGLKDYESPAGGCLLTDESFSVKMREFIEHDTFALEDIPVLKVGRHLRLKEGAKLVIGRNKEENEIIKPLLNDKFIKIQTQGIPGPISLINADATKEDIALACKIILSYCKTVPEKKYTLKVGDTTFSASPFANKEAFAPYMLLKS